MNVPWTIQLFGGLCACSGSERITRFATHKTAALLAFLAYHRDQTHPRELLIELLWPECDPTQGRNRLSTLLTFLRRLLEPPGTPAGTVLQADHSHIRLHPDLLTTDVAAFERLLQRAGQAPEGSERIALLQEAIALYQEGLLPGFYDDWVLREQQRLSTRYVEAQQELAWNLEQTGALEPAQEAVSKALAVDPYREALYRLQMRLYAAQEQFVAAQQTYQTVEHLLREELNVAPSAATRELAEQLRREPRVLVRERETAAPTTARAAMGMESASPQPPPVSVAPLTNLPVSLTPFFGRDELTLRLRDWLTGPAPRLVTLTGPGGVGKTRLAVEVAHSVASAFAGRVWFVDLASLQDGLLLPFALAHTLQVTLSPQSDPLEQVVRKLQEGPSLLLLDNFEHLLRAGVRPSKSDRMGRGESALLVRLLLEQAPALKCLVTSRQPLHLGGEQALSVPALEVPAHSDTPERLLEYAGVALYVDRSQAVRPEFALTPNNAETVIALCRRLEGMPLAIEMAAAWARTLPPAKMLERLERQLELLVSRRRDLPARQQSLRATLEWSYDLLEPELCTCFARLSVFRGGFSVEAVEALCGSGSVEYLSALQEHSLVLCEEAGEALRYRMLESMREYGSEKLRESGTLAQMQQRHAGHFLALAEEAETRLIGPEQGMWLERLESEHDNLRAALTWSLEEGNREKGKGKREEEAKQEQREEEPSFPFSLPSLPFLEVGLRLCGALQRFWQVRGHLWEGRKWYATALSGAPSQVRGQARAKALYGAGVLANFQGDYGAAQSYFEESLSIYREINNKEGVSDTLVGLGNMAYFQGDYGAARTYFEESLAIRREVGDRRSIANSLLNLGGVVYTQGDPLAAQNYFEESLALYREIEDRGSLAYALMGLGNVAGLQGDYGAARTYYEESLTLYREIGDKRGMAGSLNNLGGIAYSQGDYGAARTYVEESLVARREIGDRSGIAYSLVSLGGIAYSQGDHMAARTYFVESLAHYRDLGNRSGLADLLEAFASLEVAAEQPERAVQLWGAAAAQREVLGYPRLPASQEAYEHHRAIVHKALGEEAFAKAWQAGQAMSLEQAVEYARAETKGSARVAVNP